jgi:hypothetical protein
MISNGQGQHFLSVSPRFRKSSAWGTVLGIMFLEVFVSASNQAVFTVFTTFDREEICRYR